MQDENDDIHWVEEGKTIINDVKKHVYDISISNLPCSDSKIFFNLTTLEMKHFCIELSVKGFRIVGEKYDSDECRSKYSIFETPYSLLDSISPAYRVSFGNQLAEELNRLKEEQSDRKEDSAT